MPITLPAAMRFALFFILVAGYCLYRAWPDPLHRWLLVWMGVSYLLAAAAYGGIGPAVFGKGPDGRLSWISILLLLPFLLVAWLIWSIQALLTPRGRYSQVSPGVYLGRKPFARTLPADVGMIVDLTCEFPASAALIGQRRYRSLPTLDWGGPDPRRLAQLLRELAGYDGVMYLHCAQGHGRSATVAAGLLILRGRARDIDDAVRVLRESRPRVRINRRQRKALEEALKILDVRMIPLATRSPADP